MSAFLNPVMVGYAAKPLVPFDTASVAKQFTKNMGNLLFVQGLETIVESPYPLIRTPQGSSFKNLSSKTALLAPMSNHIGSHVDLSCTHRYLANVPHQVLLVGIGLQSDSGKDPCPPESSIRWLRRLNEAGGAIWTRGSNTSAFLDRIGVLGTTPIGCPSLFINPSPSLGEMIKKKVDILLRNGISRLAVAAGNPFSKVTEKLRVERKLVGLLDDYDGSYIVQSPMPLICLALGWSEGLNLSVLKRIKQSLFIDKDQASIHAWFRSRSTVFVDVSQWLLSLNSYDLVLGTRIHGVQAAIQAGVPAVCITHDSRTEELCRQMCIPSLDTSRFLDVGGLDVILKKLSCFDFANFDQNRVRLARSSVDFLEANGVRSSTHIRNIVNL